MRRKARLLVELLALQEQHQLHREQIIEFLWRDQDLESALNNLHKTIHAVRRALEPGLASGNDSHYILTRDQQVILSAPQELWIDVEVFEKLAKEALQQADIAACETALAQYGGDLLAEDPYIEWATERRERLRVTYRNLRLKLAAHCEESGQYEHSIALYQSLVADDSLNEDAHRRLMLLYGLTGDRHQAIRQYQQCRAALCAELGVEPEAATRELSERIAAGLIQSPKQIQTPASQHRSKLSAQPKAITNLPHPMNSFIGRTKEVAEVKRLLAHNRLLTLTGPGGIGKTRLATEVAAQLISEFTDGVWLIELASLTNPALVPQTVASVFGVREEAGRRLVQTLCGFFRAKQVLLVLDNCEHVIEASAMLADSLLQACPCIRVLSTSREALGVAGEAIWRVSTLSCPAAISETPAARVMDYESVQLFLERARLSNPGWQLTEQNAPTVAKLCCRLDGIPLAIELAAARMKMFTVEQILARLDDRFRLLTEGGRTIAPRHKTLRATIDWSYDLLSVEEQALWRRLSIFAGGWTLEAAEVVCADEGIDKGAVLDILSHLIDKSLVIADQEGADSRYRFLETIRQYGAQKRRAQQEEARICARHFDWSVQLAERADSEFSGPEQRAWFEHLETEHDNLRAALQWSIHEAKEADLGLRLCNALWRFWQAHGYSIEGRRWLNAALSLGPASSTSLRARAFHGASALASVQGDFEDARLLLEQSLALQRETDDKPGIAHELQRLGIIAYYIGDYQQAAKLQEESLLLCEELGDLHGLARAMGGLGILALDQGDYAQAALRFEDSLSIYRRESYQLGIMVTLNNLGETAHRQGDYDQAEQLLHESLAMAQDMGDKGWIARSMHVLGHVAIDRGDYPGALHLFRSALTILREIEDAIVVHVLEGLACTAAAQGQAHRAICLAEAANQLRQATRMHHTPAEQATLERHLDKVRPRLSLAERMQAQSLGRAMTLDQAVAYAFQSE